MHQRFVTSLSALLAMLLHIHSLAGTVKGVDDSPPRLRVMTYSIHYGVKQPSTYICAT